MGSYLSEPVTEKISSDEENDKLLSGASSMQGWRISQEDAHNCILDFDVNTSLFAVYDGHGGHEVAQYCSKKLPDFLKNISSYKNNDMEKALIDAFLGFDATIATPEVIAELKEIVGVKVTENETDGSDVEDNVANLYEEATMPLEQVIEKYTSNLKHPHLQHLQKGGDKLPSSPYLRARKENTNESSSTCGESSGSSKCTDSSSSSKNTEEKETKETESKSETSKIETEEEKSIPTKDEKPLQNGDSPSPAPETNSDEVTHQGNGEIANKRKGKALTKTKGVEKTPTSIKTRPKRNAQQLYSNLLDFESDSESEDEEDKTFQGSNDSSSEDDAKPNEGDNSEVSSEVGEEETDDMEEEEDLEEEEDEEDNDEMDEADLEFARNMREEPGSDSGCTAVVALLRENQLYVANAGDSRCIVCRNGKAFDMSVDHKPEDELESQRIVKAGGKVTSDGRVNGGLNLSRAIGDHAYKQKKELSDQEQMITALPDVRTLTINPKEDEFMVLACDGIWNFMSSQQVVDFVKSKLENSPEKLSKICEQMFDHCLAPDTMCDGTGCDNMTAIIVQFKNNICKRAAQPVEESENTKRVKTDQPETTS